MAKRIAKNIHELIEYWKEDLKFVIEEVDEYGSPLNWSLEKDDFKAIEIDFELNLPFSNEVINSMEAEALQNIGSLIFSNCVFKQKITIGHSDRNIEFNNDCIIENVVRVWRYSGSLKFRDSNILSVNFEDAIFGSEENTKKGKVRFHNCIVNEANFRNTTFNSLADFWNTTFIKPVIFYKTDFLETTVFSAAIFKENVLFTYTLLNSVSIFRGAKFEKGLDLSLAILKGDLNLFDLKVKYFNHSEPKSENDYEQDVSENGNIPLKNKQETYRIIKKYYDGQSNNIRALDFKYLERSAQSKALSNEFFRKEIGENEHWLYFLYSKLKAFTNQVIQVLNFLSNGHGKSYFVGFVFTFVIGCIFFSLSMLGTSKYTFDLFSGDIFIVDDNISHFLNFLNPTHKFDYLGDDFSEYTLGECFYICDFLGRIFVGYGIYQTVQAFRKYR
ncbi:pentapeptide repeat-containing protein [Tenacibaculum sp. 190524A05c]|uniref:pentapeptide repeat-containing protein n=1 Tax=Tenacibaculum platacis TaxID=3137852 RepID=UPI0032B1ABCE